MNKMIYEKVEFKLPEGWTIKNNTLFKIEEELIKNLDNDTRNKLSEDMLNIVNHLKNIIIDVGWYPQFDINGHFGLVVVKDNIWIKPIDTLVTRDINVVIDKVNKIMEEQ
ncbi:MAG: hypothetical protein ACI398_05015 [Clostridium sp.]